MQGEIISNEGAFLHQPNYPLKNFTFKKKWLKVAIVLQDFHIMTFCNIGRCQKQA